MMIKRISKLNRIGQSAAEMAIFGSLILICFSVLLTYGQRLDAQQQIKMEAFRKALQKAWDINSSVSYTVEKDHRFFNLMGGFGQGQPSSLSASASVMWQKGASGSQGTTDDTSFSFYEINDQMIGSETTGLPRYDKTVIGHDGTPTTSVNVPAGVWKKEIVKVTGYDSTAIKDEADGGVITNIQESDLGETVITRLYTRFDKAETDAGEAINVPEYVYADSANNTYEYEGDTITVTPPLNAESSQGAYDDEDINRIKYSKDEVGAIIHKQRTWTTEE